MIADCLVLSLATTSVVPEPIPPAFDWAQLEARTIALTVGVLCLSALFAVLRQAMTRAITKRVLGRVPEGPARVRLERPLARIDTLSTSAGVLAMTSGLAFTALLLQWFAGGQPLGARALLLGVAISVPILWFTDDVLARALAQRHGDRLLVAVLPIFSLLQMPLAAIAWGFDNARRGVLRLFGLRDDMDTKREIVAGLREVIEDSEISGNLDDTERELIENVMEFRDVDVAAVMTPRTEADACDIEDGLLGAAQIFARSGHSRIPIFEDTLDTIVGTVSARDLVQVIAADKLQTAVLSEILHPAYFVPETKHISELLGELRREKIKMAIVLDEYGGTAGLVTVGDIISEIVGDLPDEYDTDEPSPIRHLQDGAAEVEASLHVTEVNEALDLDIPEEADYETLGGFVLAELGHFPERGEAFVRGDIEYAVVEANDRRVLKVRVTK